MDPRRGPWNMEEDCCLSITPTTTAAQIRSLDAQAKQNLKRTANVKFDSSSDSFKTKIASRTVFKKKGQITPKQQCRKNGSHHKNPVCYSKKIERKKAIETQRKAAREALQKLEESIHIYDDYDFMKDLVSLGLIPPEQLAQPDTL